MINLKIIYDLITAAFHESHSMFKWGDNAIFRGSLKKLPAPDKINDIAEGDYFALVEIESVTPKEIGSADLWQPAYNFNLVLCYKGKVGDVTKIRTDIANNFIAGWQRFWTKQNRYIMTISNIIPQVDEVEDLYNVIAVMVVGSIERQTTKYGIKD